MELVFARMELSYKCYRLKNYIILYPFSGCLDLLPSYYRNLLAKACKGNR